METAVKKKEIDWMKVAKATGITILGILSGKIAGSAIGKASGVVGLGTMGGSFVIIDKYKDSFLGYFVLGAGAGMIASPVVAVPTSEVQGLTGFGAVAADAGQGAKLAIANLSQKFFLDKTPLAKFIPTVAGVNGFSGLGNSPEQLSDDEAQRIIQEMINEKRSEGTNGLSEDYGVNGLADDYGVGDLGRSRWRDSLKKGFQAATHPSATVQKCLRGDDDITELMPMSGIEDIADLAGLTEDYL